MTGVLKKLHHQVGDVVKNPAQPATTSVLQGPSTTSSTHEEAAVAASLQLPSPGAERQGGGETTVGAKLPPSLVLAAPAIRRLARDNNVNLALVRGSGTEGRITKEDLWR
eukprot:gene32266-16832_t